MGSHTTNQDSLNFLPYLECYNSKTRKKIKLLIDSGANKNIIKPKIIPQPTRINTQKIKNILGTQEVNLVGSINLLGHDISPQTYYILDFHKFFDGLLGSEFFAQTGSIMNYKSMTMTIAGHNFQMKKYFPNNQFYYHTITIKTKGFGDWLVPTERKLFENISILPGIYRSNGAASKVVVMTKEPELPKKLPTFEPKFHNFETLKPIPIEEPNRLTEDAIRPLIRTTHLSKYETDELIGIIFKNQDILLRKNEKLSATTAIKHKIITRDENPVYAKSYRQPPAFKRDIEEQIEEMLENKILQHSKSPYSAPTWVVPKKPDASGKKKVRLVIDYRKLNEKTIDDKYPIPQMEEILDNLGDSEYFTTLDLKSGFHQIEMHKDHQMKTAFSTDKGHYEFLRMPFGLKNAPATFQRAMNHVLEGLIGKTCYVYLDDIVVFGSNLEAHLRNLEKVFKRLTDFNLKIQLDKCEFLKRETEFLGHLITPEGIKPNPDKIRKIQEWPIPKTEKQIKQFLGLSGYYRRFIKDYSKLTKPMTKYLKDEQKLNISDPEYQKAFEKLKKILTSDQILAYPDFNKPFILTTDASDYAIGAVLSQIQNGVEKPIAFGSRTLNDTEIKYATYEKEALAIVWAVKKYKPYLHDQQFTLVTDHKPLTFIKSADKNSKVLRWRLELESFDYKVVYKEGKNNVVADALSRIPSDPLSKEMEINATSLDGNVSESTLTAHSADTSDDHFIHFSERPLNYYRNQIIFRISRINTIVTETPFPNFRRTIICNDQFTAETMTEYLRQYYNGRQTAIMAPEDLYPVIQTAFRSSFSQHGHFILATRILEDVIDEGRQNLLISTEHERAHRGIQEVGNQLKRSYFFPRMNNKIKNYINTCRICYMHKYDRKPYNIKISNRPITDKPLERLHMDIFIINHTNFLSIIDSFSKHLQMIHMKTKNMTDVQNALSKYISTFGPPRVILSDHETTFTSIQLRNFLANFNIQIEHVSSSESNGQVEKTHSTIIELYNTNKHKFRSNNTKTIIRACVAYYNNSVHSSTSFTPNEILFNNNNLINLQDISTEAQRIFAEASSTMRKKQEVQEKLNETREDPPSILENETVFLKPNIRTKTQPRGMDTEAHNVGHKTFLTTRNIKRNKNKTKRKKKTPQP